MTSLVGAISPSHYPSVIFCRFSSHNLNFSFKWLYCQSNERFKPWQRACSIPLYQSIFNTHPHQSFQESLSTTKCINIEASLQVLNWMEITGNWLKSSAKNMTVDIFLSNLVCMSGNSRNSNIFGNILIDNFPNVFLPYVKITTKQQIFSALLISS